MKILIPQTGVSSLGSAHTTIVLTNEQFKVLQTLVSFHYDMAEEEPYDTAAYEELHELVVE